MEIEVGEWVRTKAGLIAKVVYKIEENSFISKSGRKCTSPERYYLENIKKYSISKPYIAKHSKNIIDLIQEGDYVNGHLVVDKYKDTDDYGNDFITIEVESDLMLHKSLEEKHIKSIVTKEQFSSVEYLLEEE